MKETTDLGPKPAERRRFLSLLGGLGAAVLTLPFVDPRKARNELDLKEADFYRPHDLAG